MRLFKATYKDRRGKVQESAKWYCEFRDHLEIVRRLPLYTDQKASAEAGRKIERLVALRMAGCEPDTELTRWVESLEGRLVGKLAEIGLLSPSRLSAARPLAELIESWEGALKAKGINRHPRRVVTPAEIAHLLVKTGQEPVRYGMTGPERALVYRLAVETGLRANELACLCRSNLKLDEKVPVVTIWNGTDKNAKGVDVPLLPSAVERLRVHCRDMLPGARLFSMPDSRHVAEMFRTDLLPAGIPYVDAARLFFDFHCLRACTASFLGDAGVPVPVIRDIMRHADIQTTMRYVKTNVIQSRAQALTQMPSLDAVERLVMEATNDKALAVGFHTENAKQDAKTEGAITSSACAHTDSQSGGTDSDVCPALCRSCSGRST